MPRDKIKKGGIVCPKGVLSALNHQICMARNYKPIPGSTNELLMLCDKTPSGLRWTGDSRNKIPGAPVTRLDKNSGMYRVSLGGVVFLAHRIVYYLRHGVDPGGADVIHGADNPAKDNRLSLHLSYVYQKKTPSYPTESTNLN